MPSRRNEVSSVEEFYAHALHIERETAARYWEFANQLLLFRQNEVATVFLALAQSEYEDLDRLERQAAALRLPALASSDHRWHIEDEGEEALPVARCLMKPHGALETALRNQRRARKFYERISRSARNPDVSRLAVERVLQETRHIECLERALRER